VRRCPVSQAGAASYAFSDDHEDSPVSNTSSHAARTPVDPGLSIRDVIRGTLHAWRRDLVYVTLLAGVVQLPVVLVDVWAFGHDGVSFSSDDTANHWAIGLIVTLSAMLTHHLLAGVLEEFESADRGGHERPAVRELMAKLPWPRLVVADVIIAVVVVGGVLAFVVPGLIVASLLSLVMPLLNIERRSVPATFRRSVHLTRPFLVAVCAIWIPAQLLVSIGSDLLDRLIHVFGHSFVFDVTGHLFPEMLLLPLGALPAVIMTYRLLDREAALAVDEDEITTA
jgi:hypothetical protein